LSFLTISIVTLIVVLSAIEIYLIFKTRHSIRATITTIGVIGTFVGIVFGLYGFDYKNPEASLPELLEGLKTAFITSIAGMISYVVLVWISKFKKYQKTISSKDVLQSILQEIQNGNSSDKRILQEIERKLEKLETLENLNTKLEKLETLENLENELKELVSVQKTESKKMNDTLEKTLNEISKGASEEIIKALQEVIKDFNSNLSEQFGDNFKQLNSAVVEMVSWQENYKNFVEETEKNLTKIVSSMTSSDKTLNSIASKNSETLETYEKIADVIATYKHQTEEITKHLQTYSELSEKAKEIFPNIEKTQNEFVKSSKSLPENLQNFEKTMNSLSKQFLDNYSNFLQELAKISKG
jgi:chromosome segregation ATPase